MRILEATSQSGKQKRYFRKQYAKRNTSSSYTKNKNRKKLFKYNRITEQKTEIKEFENEISLLKIDPIIVEANLSIIAVVGDQMKNHQGISGKMFSTLGRNNINIRAIAQGASERNISAVIAESDIKKALNCLHERFFESEIKQINLFISGVENVGKSLINQIKKQKKQTNN